MEMLEKEIGLCFSYLFCSIVITSVLYQWPKSLVHEVMVFGLNLFMNPSFVVVTLGTAMEVSIAGAMSSMRKTMLWTLGVKWSFWNGY